MSYQFAKVNGTRIHYDVQGEGTAVTFIHAGIVDLGMWDEQVAVFVAAGYRVIRYDLRGWGETVMPAGEFSDVDDLRGLLGHLGVEKTAARRPSRPAAFSTASSRRGAGAPARCSTSPRRTSSAVPAGWAPGDAASRAS